MIWNRYNLNRTGFANIIKTDGLSVLHWMDVTGQKHIPSFQDHGDNSPTVKVPLSKDMCGSVLWQIKRRLIIYFSTHLRSRLEIRPHGSEVKVTSCTWGRLVSVDASQKGPSCRPARLKSEV